VKDRSLRIGATVYDFKVCHIENSGETHHSGCIIKINSALTPLMQGRTAIHEILHAGLEEYCSISLTEDQEEGIVRALENTLAGFSLDEFDTFLEILYSMGDRNEEYRRLIKRKGKNSRGS